MVSPPAKNLLAGVLLRNAAAAIGRDCVGTPSMSGSSGTILRNAAHAAVGPSPKFLDGSCDLRTSNHKVPVNRAVARGDNRLSRRRHRIRQTLNLLFKIDRRETAAAGHIDRETVARRHMQHL